MRWERWKHRRVDGIATRRDRRALRRSARFGTRLLHVGMRGRDVRGLQWHLGRVGFGTSIDGAFGPLTKAAVMRWERSRSRHVNGVASRRDQNALRHTRRNRTRQHVAAAGPCLDLDGGASPTSRRAPRTRCAA